MKIKWFAFLLVGLLVASELGPLCWYSERWQDKDEGNVQLDYAGPPSDKVEVTGKDLKSSRVNKSLDFDEGDFYVIKSKDRNEDWLMELFHLKYEAGNRRQLKDMFDHSPEVCLGASGAKWLKTYSPHEWEFGGRTYKIRHLLFEEPVTKKPIHVFKFVWIAPHKAFSTAGNELDFRRIRVKAVLARYWPGEAHQFLASVRDVPSPEAAWVLFRRVVIQQSSLLSRD